jgi:hypothetical protein
VVGCQLIRHADLLLGLRRRRALRLGADRRLPF